MKKILYISLFMILGILLSFLAHGVIEVFAIKLLVKNFYKYGLGLGWDHWYLIHHVSTLILLLLGIGFGYQQGQKWWKVIYIDKS